MSEFKSEKEFQIAVCEKLGQLCPKVFFWRNNNDNVFSGVIRSAYGPKRGASIVAKIMRSLNKQGFRRGMPDLSLAFDGRTIHLELKQEKKEPEIHQVWVHSVLKSCGHAVYVIRNLEDFYSIIKKENIPHIKTDIGGLS